MFSSIQKYFLRCKMLVGEVPQTLELHPMDAGYAFLQNAFWCAVEARSHHGIVMIIKMLC